MTLKEKREQIERRKILKSELEKKKNSYRILETAKRGRIDPCKRVLTSEEIGQQLDVGTKSRAYSLSLDDGPYSARYTPSGDALLCIGRTSVAGVNTQTLREIFDREMEDAIHDGVFLHRESFFALAQSKCVYIYDKTGVEVHALREHIGAKKLTYLQDHFLLGTLSGKGVLRYQDTTVGKLVSEIETKERDAEMCQDRTNGVIYLTGRSGHVSLWSPRSAEYLAKVLCHKVKVAHLKVGDSGSQLVTASGGSFSIWDARNMFAPVKTVQVPGVIGSLDVSQTGQIAIGRRNLVEVYSSEGKPVQTHYLGGARGRSLSFMPYEDILTIGTENGIENIVVPGAGLETYRRNENPKLSKRERKNVEVRRMLEKLPADMIALENELGTEVKEIFKEEIVPMKLETPAGKVRRLMKLNYG